MWFLCLLVLDEVSSWLTLIIWSVFHGSDEYASWMRVLKLNVLRFTSYFKRQVVFCSKITQYLGSTFVKELRGTESTKKSIQKLKKTCREPRVTPDITLAISYRGVRFLNTVTNVRFLLEWNYPASLLILYDILLFILQMIYNSDISLFYYTFNYSRWLSIGIVNAIVTRMLQCRFEGTNVE